MVQSADLGNQSLIAPEPPKGAFFEEPPPSILDEDGNVDSEQLELFGRQWAPQDMPKELVALLGAKSTKPKAESYPLRDNVPRQFKTQDLPEDQEVTEEEVAEKFSANTAALLDATMARAEVKVAKLTLEIITQATQTEFDLRPLRWMKNSESRSEYCSITRCSMQKSCASFWRGNYRCS